MRRGYGRVVHRQTQSLTWPIAAGTLVLIAVGAVVPLQSAYAYVDPNSAGQLFQFLFPALIAVTSFLAAFKRVIRQYWNRLTSAVIAVIRGERVPSDTEGPG